MPPPERGSLHDQVNAPRDRPPPGLPGRPFFGAIVSRLTLAFLTVGAFFEARFVLMNAYSKTNLAPWRFSEHWFSMVCLGMACLGFVVLIRLGWLESVGQLRRSPDAGARPDAATPPNTNSAASPAADPSSDSHRKQLQPMQPRSSELPRVRRSRRPAKLGVLPAPSQSAGELVMSSPPHDSASSSTSSSTGGPT